jgi:hypothetical protein
MYLVVYLQAMDHFLVLNASAYVEERWGSDILKLQQETVTVNVPTSSVLDEQAFALMLSAGQTREWLKVIESDQRSVGLALRDYTVIWRLGQQKELGLSHRIRHWQWQTKLRGQLWIEEEAASSADWVPLRQHWQLHLRFEDLHEAYPYLKFARLSDPVYEAYDLCDPDERDDCESNHGPIAYLRGLIPVVGQNHAGEVHEFTVGIGLNSLGRTLRSHIEVLIQMGLLEIPKQGGHFLSVAPWHGRAV